MLHNNSNNPGSDSDSDSDDTPPSRPSRDQITLWKLKNAKDLENWNFMNDSVLGLDLDDNAKISWGRWWRNFIETQKAHILQALGDAWDTTFPFDGYDPIFASDDDSDSHSNFKKSKITRFASFVGLPNGKPDENDDDASDWDNIRRQLLWLPNRPLTFSLKDALRFTVGLVIGGLTILFRTLPTFAINFVKLFSEYPLTILRNYLGNQNPTSTGSKIFVVSLYLLASLALFAVRSITSPGKNARSAFKFGEDLGNGGKLGKILGVACGLISLLTTIAAYTIVFPLGIKAILTQAVPYITSHASLTGKGLKFLELVASKLCKALVFVASKLKGLIHANKTLSLIASKLSNIPNDMKPFTQPLGHFITHKFAPVIKFFGLNNFSDSTIGLSATAGAAIGVAGISKDAGDIHLHTVKKKAKVWGSSLVTVLKGLRANQAGLPEESAPPSGPHGLGQQQPQSAQQSSHLDDSCNDQDQYQPLNELNEVIAGGENSPTMKA